MGYYDSISSGYEELHLEEQKKKLAIIKGMIKGLLGSSIKKGSLLLDVGCGTGITSDFSGFGRDVTVFGIDPAMKLLEKAKARKKPDYPVCAEAEHIPFKDRCFDIIVSVTAIQNFHDIAAGLDEIKRVGKEGRECIFALSFLKRSQKREEIIGLIRGKFDVLEEIEGEKDIIILAARRLNL